MYCSERLRLAPPKFLLQPRRSLFAARGLIVCVAGRKLANFRMQPAGFEYDVISDYLSARPDKLAASQICITLLVPLARGSFCVGRPSEVDLLCRECMCVLGPELYEPGCSAV